MKITNFFLAIGIMLLLLMSCADDVSVLLENPRVDNIAIVQDATVINAITGEEVGTAKLIREANEITMNYEATDLIPGHAYTVWWVIWNNPEACENSPCADTDFPNFENIGIELMYAAGNVVGEEGVGRFSGYLEEGDASESINSEFFGIPTAGGLENALTAEVHLVLRSHGPQIPGQVDEQINSYEGGCIEFLPAFTEIPDEEGECADFQFAIFVP